MTQPQHPRGLVEGLPGGVVQGLPEQGQVAVLDVGRRNGDIAAARRRDPPPHQRDDHHGPCDAESHTAEELHCRHLGR